MAGPSSTSPPVDQTSAVIAVLTVALVIVVETLRHQLDRSVSGRPFASNVVEVRSLSRALITFFTLPAIPSHPSQQHQTTQHCYRELTTLGIVEFGVFIAHKVATNFDLDVEEKVRDIPLRPMFNTLFSRPSKTGFSHYSNERQRSFALVCTSSYDPLPNRNPLRLSHVSHILHKFPSVWSLERDREDGARPLHRGQARV